MEAHGQGQFDAVGVHQAYATVAAGGIDQFKMSCRQAALPSRRSGDS